MTDKSEKDALWKDLKLQWSYLKRDSGADEVKKDMKRVMNEEFMTITQKINSLDEKMKSCTCNCTMEKSS